MDAKVAALKITRRDVVTFALLVAIATVAPLFSNQFITGPIVNATLIVATVLLGTSNGVLVGLFPSTIALGIGLLNPVLAPLVPFIIAANAIFVVVFHALRGRNYWLAVAVGAVLKAALLFGASFIVANMITSPAIAANLAQMMSWPQLVTAFAGGVLAFAYLRIVNPVK
jgi:hypothetical protein